MNEELEKFVIAYLAKKGVRCTGAELYSAMKNEFPNSNLDDEVLILELVKSTKITGKIENGTEYYTLRSSDGKPVGLPKNHSTPNNK